MLLRSVAWKCLEERKPGPEGDPHEVRRRIWGKSRPPGREDAGVVRVRNTQQIIKEEMQNVERAGCDWGGDEGAGNPGSEGEE